MTCYIVYLDEFKGIIIALTQAMTTRTMEHKKLEDIFYVFYISPSKNIYAM